MRRDLAPVGTRIVGTPDQPIIGSDPERGGGKRRGRDGIDHPAALVDVIIVGRRCSIEIRRNSRIRTRQVRTDLRPVLAAVQGPVEALVGEVQCSLAAAGERERQCPGAAWRRPGGLRG